MNDVLVVVRQTRVPGYINISMSPTTSSPTKIHLVVIIHGLWGSPEHVGYLAHSLRKARGHSSADGTRLDILLPSSIQWTNTYDGIDYCAEHVAQEIDLRRHQLESDCSVLSKFSVVGYSLGGLIGRFLIGLLHSRQPSFFEKIEPMSFNTFASPWIGMPRYKGILSSTIHFFGSRLLSRTGNQLYLADKYHQLPHNKPKTNGLVDESTTKTSKKKFPLLCILAHPDTNFYKALTNFKVVNVYANSINDRTVPFVTGALEKNDLFQIFKELSRKSKLINKQTDLTDLEIFRIAGLDIKFNPNCSCLIETVQAIGNVSHSESLDNLISEQEATSQGTTLERWKQSIPKLPFFLKPSTYPFRTPLNYLAAGLSPVIAPIFVLYIISSFCYQSYQSRRRIKNYTTGDLDHYSSRLRRVGLLQEIEQDLIEDIAGIGNQTSFENNPTIPVHHQPSHDHVKSADDQVSSSHQDTPSPTENSHLIHSESSGDQQPSPHSVSINDTSSNECPVPTTKGTNYSSSTVLQEIKLVKHDLGLSNLQINMLDDLNRLPNLIKFFAFFDGIHNAHGAIIYRAEGFSNRRGKKIVHHWAERFLL